MRFPARRGELEGSFGKRKWKGLVEIPCDCWRRGSLDMMKFYYTFSSLEAGLSWINVSEEKCYAVFLIAKGTDLKLW